jgi:hypothetical protein
LNHAHASLHQLSQSEPNHLPFNTEIWLGLQVKQPRLPVETGYRSFWDHLNLSVINNDISDSANSNGAIINFFQDWTENNLQSITDETIAQSLDKITKGLQEWIDSSISAMDEETISQRVEEVVEGFKELANPSYNHEDIFQGLVNFFIEDDWAFIKVEGEPILGLTYQGKNCTWNLYAKVYSK